LINGLCGGFRLLDVVSRKSVLPVLEELNGLLSLPRPGIEPGDGVIKLEQRLLYRLVGAE